MLFLENTNTLYRFNTASFYCNPCSIQESKQSGIWMLWCRFCLCFYDFLIDFGTVLTLWYLFVFHFVRYMLVRIFIRRKDIWSRWVSERMLYLLTMNNFYSHIVVRTSKIYQISTNCWICITLMRVGTFELYP